MGCNFCTTSSFSGGQVKFLDFYQTGKEIHEIMTGLAAKLKVKPFFVMDVTFLHNRKRAKDVGTDETGREKLRIGRLQFPQRHPQTHDRRTGFARVSWIWMAGIG